MTIIPPTAPEAESARDILAKASEGDIFVALMAGHVEFSSRQPLEFHPYWEVQALPGGGDSPFHGTGDTLHEALVECGVQTPNTATRVKELSEPNPLDRALSTLAELAAHCETWNPTVRQGLVAAILAVGGMGSDEAIDRAAYDSYGPLSEAASDRADELIKAAKLRIRAREQAAYEAEIADELAAVAS